MYVATVPVPPLASSEGETQQWSAFFVAVTFHGAAPGMTTSTTSTKATNTTNDKKKQPVGSDNDSNIDDPSAAVLLAIPPLTEGEEEDGVVIVGGGGGGGGGDNEMEDSTCASHKIGLRRYCLPLTKVGDITLTTNVVITPDFLPFSCSGEECQGGTSADLL